MPPYSSLRTFINALREGRTRITSVLEELANDPQARATYGQQLADPATARGDRFPDWLRTELNSRGLSWAEIEHMERWPASEKEKARAEIKRAADNGREVACGWQLSSAYDPVTEVPADASAVRLVFASPARGVRLSGMNYGSVQVEA